MHKQYYIYIATNKSYTLYIGVTNDLGRRMNEHRLKIIPGFTARYNIDTLVYFEIYADPETAITREKEIKKWRRQKKIDLIKIMNPDFKNLNDLLN